MNPHAVEEATRPLQQDLQDAQARQREVARDTARAQAALQAALSRREALEIRVSSGRGRVPRHHHADDSTRKACPCKCLQSFSCKGFIFYMETGNQV